jgi:hypothetical protein
MSDATGGDDAIDNDAIDDDAIDADDALRVRLARTDPMRRGAPTDPATSPVARALLEDIMSTPPDTDHTNPTTGAPGPSQQPAREPSRNWLAIGGIAAAVVAIVAVGAVAVTNDDGSGDGIAEPATSVTDGPTGTTPDTGDAGVLALDTGTEDLMASCAVLDPAIVAQAPVAFRGTVTSVDGAVVQLTVDQAYAGVTEPAVILTAPEGMEALIGGVAWQVGESYLVTAYDGVVAYCGQTGPATPELQAIFDQAFPA